VIKISSREHNIYALINELNEIKKELELLTIAVKVSIKDLEVYATILDRRGKAFIYSYCPYCGQYISDSYKMDEYTWWNSKINKYDDKLHELIGKYNNIRDRIAELEKKIARLEFMKR